MENLVLHRPPRKIEQTVEATCPYCHRMIYREWSAEIWDETLGGYVSVQIIEGRHWIRSEPDGRASLRFPVCICPSAKKHPITEAAADIVRPIERSI